MGLDLTIREQRNFRTDENGHNVWDTVELTNLRNCWEILNKLSNRCDMGFQNCSTVSFCEGTFFAILNELLKEAEDENTNKYDYEIEKLEEFIAQEELQEQKSVEESTDEAYGRTFEVHAWW